MRWLRRVTVPEVLALAVVSSALLAAVVPRVRTYTPRDPEARLRLVLAEIRNALLVFYHDTGIFPQKLEDLAATEPPVIGLDRWQRPIRLNSEYYNGPYLHEVPRCPISGKELEYYCDPLTGVMRVRSPAEGVGSDGVPYREW
ncbi:MAG: hypothetical protein RMK45_06505 [Armatimonadota bacterium]|nr:hypothetical protein [Armatimonadota bacterium]